MAQEQNVTSKKQIGGGGGGKHPPVPIGLNHWNACNIEVVAQTNQHIIKISN